MRSPGEKRVFLRRSAPLLRGGDRESASIPIKRHPSAHPRFARRDGEYERAPEKGLPPAPRRTCVEDTPFIPAGLDSEDCEMRMAGDLGCITFMNLGYRTRKLFPDGQEVAGMR